jgi:hypothetical protein
MLYEKTWVKEKNHSLVDTFSIFVYIFYVAGLFSYSHMEFEANRDRGPEGDPSLAKMTRTALKILTRNPRGFFLFVESKCEQIQFSLSVTVF